MAVTINFNTLTASTNNLGKIGEHNSTELTITYTNSDERCSQYRIAFATGKEVILSETYTEMPINIYLWQQLTKCPRISIQVLCYDDDGEYISKSAKMSGFYFEPSIGNTTVEADGSNPDMAGEINDLDTRLTSAEADIDTLDAGKQAKITSTNKLPYSLISGTPTIPTIPTNVSAFTNDAGYLTSHQDISGKADKTYVDTQLLYKQDKLTAGENITITEEGVISAEGGGSVDAYTKAETDSLLNAKANTSDVYTKAEVDKKSHLELINKDVSRTTCLYTNAQLLTFYNEGRVFTYDGHPLQVRICDATRFISVYLDGKISLETSLLIASAPTLTFSREWIMATTEDITTTQAMIPSTTKQAEWDAKLDASAITNLVDKTDDVATSITDSTTTTLLPNVGAVKGYVDAQISTVLNTSFGGDS